MVNETAHTDHRGLPVWQHSRELVKLVYKMTAGFPSSEQLGLTVRMRRSAVAVVSGIAEAFGRREGGRRVRSLDMARGSAFELETQLILAGDLGFAYDVEKEVALLVTVGGELDELIENEDADSK